MRESGTARPFPVRVPSPKDIMQPVIRQERADSRRDEHAEIQIDAAA